MKAAGRAEGEEGLHAGGRGGERGVKVWGRGGRGGGRGRQEGKEMPQPALPSHACQGAGVVPLRPGSPRTGFTSHTQRGHRLGLEFCPGADPGLTPVPRGRTLPQGTCAEPPGRSCASARKPWTGLGSPSSPRPCQEKGGWSAGCWVATKPAVVHQASCVCGGGGGRLLGEAVPGAGRGSKPDRTVGNTAAACSHDPGHQWAGAPCTPPYLCPGKAAQRAKVAGPPCPSGWLEYPALQPLFPGRGTKPFILVISQVQGGEPLE